MRSLLTKSSTLWALGILSVLLMVGFGAVMRVYGFTIIDEVSDPERIRAHIAAMTETQKQAHIWTTAVLDVAFPLAYGGLFIGLALRFFGRAGVLFALPGMAVIPVDFVEGAIQVMALSGNDNVIVHKAWVTPLKLGLFIAGMVIALVAIGIAVKRRFASSEVS